MRTIALAFRYLWSRPLAALLNLLLLTLGIAAITFVLIVRYEVDRAFERDLAGIDAVVGAKGSPLQLIMAGVFQVDEPPGNVPLAEVQRLSGTPVVARVIPISLADSYRGFRIVGTTSAYLDHYRVRVASGELWRRPNHAVLGAEVARATTLRPGASFVATHGVVAGGDEHTESPYQVMGVLAPCNCVLDRLIVTTNESVSRLHELRPQVKPGLRLAPSFSMAPASAASAAAPAASSAEGAPATPGSETTSVIADEKEPQPEVSLALVFYRSPLAAKELVRFVNTETHMQVASPRNEVSRVVRLLGVGAEVLRGLGAVLLLIATLSVFAALWNAVRERRADLAMLRMLGASPAKIGALLVSEAFWLAILGSALGLVLGHTLAGLLGQVLQAEQSLPLSGWVWVPGEQWVPLAALAAAGIAAISPAISAYRVDAAQMLNAR